MRQVRKTKPVRVKPTDDIIELKPGVWMFTPAWKVKSNAR